MIKDWLSIPCWRIQNVVDGQKLFYQQHISVRSTNALDELQVDLEGDPHPLKEVATINKKAICLFALFVCQPKGVGKGGPGPSNFWNSHNKCIFNKTHNQSLRKLYLTAFLDLRA